MLNYKKFILFPLIFLFLPAFCIPAGALSSFFPLYNLALLIFFVLFGIVNIKNITVTVSSFTRNTAFNYFFIFIIWCIFTDILFLITGNLSIGKVLYSLIVIIAGYYIMYSLYPLFLTKVFNSKTIYKVIVFSIWLILIWGILYYIGILFNIPVIKIIASFICNKHSLQRGVTEQLIARNKSVFTEPGFYGYFLNLNMLLTYQVSKSKYKLFENKYLNKIIKLTIFPLTIISLISTFSPINIVFAMFIGIICLLKQKSKYKISIILTLIIFLFLSFQIPIVKNSTPITRIEKTFASFSNFEELSTEESSLYTRISSYINTFCLFIKHPVVGVGTGMSKYYMAKQFEESPVPLSHENYLKMKIGEISGVTGFNLSIFTTILAETGIIGFCLLYLYFYLTIKQLKKIQKYSNGLDFDIISSLIPTMYIMLFLSVYESFLINSPYTFLIFIFANSLYLKKLKIFNKGKRNA